MTGFDQGTEVSFRRYSDEDLQSCRNLWEQLTEAHRSIYEDPDIGGEHPGMFFDDHLRKVGAENIWVAVAGDRTIGLMGLESEGDELTIEPLVVDSAWRGNGIGGRFVDIAIREAVEREVSFLNVRPVARNLAALGFFGSKGLSILGHIELFMDLKSRRWKEGVQLHGVNLRF